MTLVIKNSEQSADTGAYDRTLVQKTPKNSRKDKDMFELDTPEMIEFLIRKT